MKNKLLRYRSQLSPSSFCLNRAGTVLLVRTRTELAKCFTLGNNKFTKIKSKIVI